MKNQPSLALSTLLPLILLVITSCASPASTTPVIAQETPKAIPTSIPPTSTSTFPTPQITPKVTTMFSNLEEVTDGKLKLSIDEAKKDSCYEPGTKIRLLLIYENLTDQPLKIADYSLISSHPIGGSHGQLYPVLATEQSIRILSLEDSMLITLYNPNPNTLKVLPSKAKFNVLAEYYLSTKFASAGTFGGEFQPIPDGQYYLKFIYSSIGYDGSWKGDISSNRILICVK